MKLVIPGYMANDTPAFNKSSNSSDTMHQSEPSTTCEACLQPVFSSRSDFGSQMSTSARTNSNNLSPYMQMCVHTIMQLATMQLSQLVRDSPLQGLDFINMIKAQLEMLKNGTNVNIGLTNRAVSPQQGALLATCDQALHSITRALVQIVISEKTVLTKQ